MKSRGTVRVNRAPATERSNRSCPLPRVDGAAPSLTDSRAACTYKGNGWRARIFGVRCLPVLILLGTLAGLARVASAAPPPAEDPPEEVFKRALFDEEGRRDYPAALRGYEQVIRALDEQRRLAATAVFRLGECYRKLGRTNDAVAQYQRLLREFSGEDTLAQLCRQNLAGLGLGSTPAPTTTAAAATGTGLMSDPQFASALGTNATRARSFEWFVGGGPPSPVTPANSDEARAIQRFEALATRSPDLLDAVNPDKGAPNADKTPLAEAAEKGQLAVVQFLLDHGADPKSTINGLGTALAYAARAGHKTVVELLLERGTPVDAAPRNRVTALHWAAAAGFRGIVEVLLDHGADPNPIGHIDTSHPRTPLGSAISGGHRTVAELLLAKGADPNVRARDGFPALSLAATPELVRLLLEHHADPNVDGGYRLMKALQADDRQTLDLLLEAGAKPDLTPSQGDFEPCFETTLTGERIATRPLGHTPLYIALASQRWAEAELLVKHGADINRLTTPEAIAPVHLGALGPGTNILAWVLDHGGDPNLIGGKEFTPLELTSAGQAPLGTPRKFDEDSDLLWDRALLLLAHGADPSRRYTTGWTLLHAAVGTGQSESVTLAVLAALAGLAERGTNIDVNVVGPQGRTPLMLAAAFRSEVVVDWLLKRGAAVDATDSDGTTALLHAAVRRRVPIVRRLLAAGADPNRACRSGQTALVLILQQNWPMQQESDGRLGWSSFGRTPDELRDAEQELQQLLRQNAGTNAPQAASAREVRSPRSSTVAFFGAVQGTVDLSTNENLTVTEALLTHGYSARADLKRVRIHRHPDALAEGEPPIVDVDVAEMLRTNDRAKDVRLRPGDRVEVKEKVL